MPAIHAILSDGIIKHMRIDPARLRSEWTIEVALGYLRDHDIGSRVVYIYVVDAEDKLVGVLPTRRLLRAKTSTRIGEIMVSPAIAIRDTATVLDACEFFILHRLLAFPVINGDGRLAGQVDIDLYTDEVEDFERRRESDDVFQLVGVHLTEAQQRKTLLVAAKRFPWLICNVVGGMIAALIADGFADVATLVVVTPFIALVTGMAEGVAIQSVSLALQTMHGVRPTWATLLRRLGREILIGLLLGALCGLIVGVISTLWKGNGWAGLSLFIGITGGVMASAAIGMALPFLLRMIRRDPQLASGPIALAAADMITLLLYFNLGRWLLL